MPADFLQVPESGTTRPTLAPGDWWSQYVGAPQVATAPVQEQTRVDAPELFARLAAGTPRSPFLAQIALETQPGPRLILRETLDLAAPGGPTVIWSNKDQPGLTELRLALNPQTQRFEIRFRHKRAPANAHELYEVLRLQWFQSQHLTIQIADRENGIRLFRADWPAGLIAPPDPEQLALAEDLDAIQRRVRRIIPFQAGGAFSADEEQTIAKLRTILHRGGFTTTWRDHTVIVPPATARMFLRDLGRGQSAGLQTQGPATETLFGVVLPLGPLRFTFAEVRLTDPRDVRAQLARAANETTPIAVRLMPGDDATVRAEYLDWAPPAEPPTLALDLPAPLAVQLRAAAARLGISPQALARATLQEALQGHEARFDAAADYLMAKNAELYRRLA